MYKLDSWDLKDILNSPKDADKLLASIERQANELEKFRSRLSPGISEKEFLSIMKRLEDISLFSARLSNYGGLWFSADTKSQHAKAFEARIQDALTPLGNKILFFSLWWKHLDEKNAQRLMKNSGDHRYYLSSIRKFKPYTLTEPEEKVINIKDATGTGSLVELYEMLKTSFRFKYNGRDLTESELLSHFRDKSPAAHKEAYDSLLKKYKEYHNEIGFVYQTVLRDFKNECISLRKYKSPISVRNLSNDLPDAAVDALLSVCQKNISIFQRYFRLKAKLLKLNKMSRYHVYAPIGSADKDYAFGSAVNMVLDSYTAFSPKMAQLVKQVIDDKHLDSAANGTKISGAFCASVTPAHVPYVLMNYLSKPRDIATLAHELGHAAHSMLASEHSIFTFHSSLPLAETASVFGEMLLTESLLQSTADKKFKLNLIAQRLDDIYATVARQAYFVLYEQKAHEAVAKGATVNELCDIYYNNLKELFGKDVDLPPDFRYEWLCIPHMFATPFYCYAYAFGNLLVLALYQRYKKEGAAFVPKYLRMLSHGGSKSPVEILKELDIDPCSEKFWQQGFDCIEDMVDEFEELSRN